SRLSMAQAKLGFDARRTAKRAADATPPPPADPNSPAGGTSAGVDVPLALSHSHNAVRAWIAEVARQAYRAPRDASVRITVRHIRLRRARVGHALNSTAAVRDVDTALDGNDSRMLGRRLRHVYPRLNANRIRRLYW